MAETMLDAVLKAQPRRLIFKGSGWQHQLRGYHGKWAFQGGPQRPATGPPSGGSELTAAQAAELRQLRRELQVVDAEIGKVKAQLTALGSKPQSYKGSRTRHTLGNKGGGPGTKGPKTPGKQPQQPGGQPPGGPGAPGNQPGGPNSQQISSLYAQLSQLQQSKKAIQLEIGRLQRKAA